MRHTRARASRIPFAVLLSACLLGGLGTGTALAQAGSAAQTAGGAAYASQPDSTTVVTQPRRVSTYVPRPRIATITCMRSCLRWRRARTGSTLRLRGYGFAPVSKVVFHGGSGRTDDVSARVRAASSRRLNVRVPVGARSGRLSAYVSRRLSSRRSRWIRIVARKSPGSGSALTPAPISIAGASLVETATSRKSVFLGEAGSVVFSYRITAAAPVPVQVKLLRAVDGAVAASWPVSAAASRTVYRVSLTGSAATSLAPGRYVFRLGAAGATAATTSSTATQSYARDAFEVYDAKFPVQGKHDFGSSGAGFGAGRSGHTHQGHDVFASCGTLLVAARGGTVQYNGYHSAAGNYLVIDGANTTVDFVYMHMTARATFAKGSQVATGQRIGSVGQTGNARGCHLHFEMWSAPGWYQGGSAFNPLPSLKAWDAFS